jgi:hypothetical protein
MLPVFVYLLQQYVMVPEAIGNGCTNLNRKKKTNRLAKVHADFPISVLMQTLSFKLLEFLKWHLHHWRFKLSLEVKRASFSHEDEAELKRKRFENLFSEESFRIMRKVPI